MKSPVRRVALLIDLDLAWERSYLEGIGRYLRQNRRTWSVYTPQGVLGLPIGDLRRWQGDGVLGFLRGRGIARFLRGSKVPAVNSSWDGLLRGLTSVVPDRRGHGVMAAEYFIRRGFRRFAFVRHEGSPIPYEEGLAERLAQEGLDYYVLHHPQRLPRNSSWEDCLPALKEELVKLPKSTAVLCISDIQAARIIAACAFCGLAVPQDLAVLGRGNDVVCRLTNPPLSSLAQNYERVGMEAAALLDKLMNGEPTPAEPILVSKTEVVERESTNLLPVEDARLREILDYISEHACDPITINDVLSQFSINRRTLQRLFLRHLYRSPHSEIARVRIGRARRLLEETDLPLSKVAKACGFSGRVSLGIAFRREAGLSPGEFRDRGYNFSTSR